MTFDSRTDFGSGFGRYLASVAERDIDLLLMEEFHANDEFVVWFSSKVGLDGILPAGAWHSVSDTDGESDLLLRVIKEGLKIGILIENKIGAPEQDGQAERYHLRGIRSREQGKVDDYRTVICAPTRYLEALSEASKYQHRVSYEAIAEWFNRQKDRRAQWRYKIMLEAIDQGRRGYTMIVSEVNTAFHLAYWEHIQMRHPRIHMAKPGSRGNYSNWIIFKGHEFPRNVYMHHKFDQQVMELGFSGRKVDDVLATNPSLPSDVMLIQKGRTASLVVRVPPIDMKLSFAEQLTEIEVALSAAYRLMPFASPLSA